MAHALRVGIFTRRRRDEVEASVPGSGFVDPSTYPISSPWSSSNLQRIVFEDIFGTDVPVNTRSAAMRIGTIARARNLIVSTISRLPLRQLTGLDPLATQPGWLTSAPDGTSPQLRMAWTVDDLIFYGWSVWWRQNDADGFPGTAQRINMGDWTINADNQVEVNGTPARPDQVIVIPGLHEGILSFGSDVLNDAAALYKTVRDRVENPVNMVDLHQTSGDPMPKEKREELIALWKGARSAKGGAAVGYSSPNIEVKELGTSGDNQLLVEARNAAAVDLARVIGVHAGLVDATAPKASLNYETQTGRNQEFIDFDLALYMTPITARLSLDDVSPSGQRIDFDTTDLTAPAPSPVGPDLED